MKNFRFACILLTLNLAVALTVPRPAMSTSRTSFAASGAQEASSSEALSPSTPEDLAEPQATATIIRTIVYRQISDFQAGGSVGSIFNMKISADGSKIIFLSGQKVFTMDATGQNLREIYDAGNDRAASWIDISANGSKVMWAGFFASEIFVANSDGSNRVRLAPTFQNQFGTEPLNPGRLNPRITADGSRVYFTHIGSTTDIAGGYRINADGTGLTKLFSYRQMAQLFGIDGSRYTGDCGACAFNNALAISDNGSRLVFGTASFSSDRNVLAFDSATGLRKITDFLAGTNEQGIAISGDGSKVVVIRTLPDREPAVAMNFDGSNQIEVSRLTGDGPFLGGMTTSGAQVLANFPDTAFSALPLINTDGSGRVDLIAPGDCDIDLFPGAPGRGLDTSLSADGRRFAFVTRPAGLPHQIWVADINPSSVGDAPAVSEVNFNPNFVLANRSTSSTFTARASGGQGGLRRLACGASLKDGAFQFRYVGFSLYDDATHGDQAANDGLYTNNQVTNDQAPPDPVNPLQIRTNVIANSLRQVTAVDATPFFVLAQAPSGSGPMITSINPASGLAGIQVTVTGSGFDPVAGNNIVLFGNRQASVKTASADRTMLTVIVPPDLAAGVVPVTVTVAAQTSNAVNFTVLGPPGACPTVSRVSPTSGPVGTTVTITGTNFTGVTAVKFSNNVNAAFTVNSDTQITATVPSGAVTGPITISKANCPDAQSSTSFTVTIPSACPTVTGINPTRGLLGSSVTITGTNFTGVTAVKFPSNFSSNIPAAFTVNSDTQITATVPPGAVTGPITLSKPNCPDAQTGTFTVLTPTRWFVWLYDIDDVGTVSVNGQQVLQTIFGQDAGMEITSFLQPGSNTVTFTLDNNVNIYSYGFDVYRDGALYYSEQCGIFNTFGCNNNDQPLGRVVTRTIVIKQ